VGVKRVLYVDDEAVLLLTGRQFLEEEGKFSVDTAVSAPAALDLLAKKPYDAIVSDYEMPKMNGIEFLRQVRTRFGSLPFILLTGRGREEVVIEALNEGADFYLQKGGDPVSQFRELTHKINKAIDHRTAEQELVAVNSEVKKRLEEEKIISEFSQVLLNASSVDEVLDHFGDMIFDLSGADYLMLTKWYPDEDAYGIHTLRGIGPLLEPVGKLVKTAPESLRVPVDLIIAHKNENPLEPGLKKIEGGLATITRGFLPRSVCTAIEALLRIKTVYVYELVWQGKFYGGINFGFRQGNEIQSPAIINTLGNLLANGLWRIYSTDAVAAEKYSLAESEAKFRNIFENSPYPIAINDFPDNKFLHVNTAFLRSSGFSEAEILGKNPIETGLISPLDATRLISQRIQKGRIENVPLTLSARDGRRVSVLFTTVPITLNNRAATLTVTSEITSLKRAEEEVLRKNEELRQSEAKFRTLFETMAQGVVFQDKEGSILSANPAAERILGLTLDQMQGKRSIDPSWMTIREDGSPLPGTDHPAMVSLRTGTTTGPFIMGVFQPVTNMYVWLSVTAIPLFLPGESEPFRVYTTFEDITERIQAEKELRESETSYRGLFNTIRQALYILDREGKFVDVNAGAEKMYGYARGEFTGRTPEFLSAPGKNDLQEIAEKIRTAFTGKPQQFEFWGLRKNGEIFPKDVFLYRGTYFGEDIVLAIGIDITERRQAENALRESENKFATVFKSNPVSLTLVSATDGRFADVNDAFLHNTGFTREDVIGKTSEELGIFSSAREYDQFIGRLRTLHHVEGMELHTRSRSGEIRTCQFSSGIILMGGKPYILSTVEDITDRKNAELAFQTMTTGMVGTTGMDSLDRITESISSWLTADCVMIGEILPDRNRVKVLSMRLDGKNVEDYSYNLEGTPCDDTAEKGFCLFSDNVASQFPKSRDLQELHIRGYAGTPLRNPEGRVIGILCILTRKPLVLPPDARKILDIIAVKAAAEIERKRGEERLARINEALLRLGTDHQKNIDSLSRLCGELLEADCVLYNRLDGGRLCVIGQWNCPPDLPASDAPEGHICSDVIQADRDGPLVVSDLQESPYAQTDPTVSAYGLKTYIGHPVRYGGEVRGSLCAVYMREFVPTVEDQKIIGILSSAVAQEEERREDQKAVRESEGKFRQTFDTAQSGLILLETTPDGMPGRIVDINNTAYAQLGYTREELMKKSYLELDAGEYQPLIADCFTLLLTRGNCSYESVRIRKDGGRFPVSVNVHRMTMNGREVIMTSARDITERKQVEEALRESEEKYRQLYDSMTDAFASVDLDGRITDFNESFTKMVGYTPEEITTRTFQDLTPEKWSMPERAIVEGQVFTRGYSDVYEKEYRRKDGTVFPVEIRTFLLKDKAGSPRGMWAIVRDITERRRAEEAIRQANRKLNLLSGITRHDIKNQIMALRSYLELSRKTLGDPARTAEFIEKEKKIVGIISSQISFTKDYETLGVKAPAWQNVSSLVGRIAHGLPMRDIQVVPGDPGLEVFADPLFEKVFHNLIDNALKYGGDQMTSIRIHTRSSGEDLILIVEDDGVGIGTEEREHLFERGFGRNTGLGLFLSREILSITGITITETGEPGRGARFEMTVPAGQYRFAENR